MKNFWNSSSAQDSTQTNMSGVGQSPSLFNGNASFQANPSPPSLNDKNSNMYENDDPPMYWNVLENDDKAGYLKMKNEIKPLITRTIQQDKAKKFYSILKIINSYIYGTKFTNESTGNSETNKMRISSRALVCGLLWLDDNKSEACAVCTRQLSKLTTKCKSSINDYFRSLNLINVDNTAEYAVKLTNSFPFLKNNCTEIRQWTIRAKRPNVPNNYNNINGYNNFYDKNYGQPNNLSQYQYPQNFYRPMNYGNPGQGFQHNQGKPAPYNSYNSQFLFEQKNIIPHIEQALFLNLENDIVDDIVGTSVSE